VDKPSEAGLFHRCHQDKLWIARASDRDPGWMKGHVRDACGGGRHAMRGVIHTPVGSKQDPAGFPHPRPLSRRERGENPPYSPSPSGRGGWGGEGTAGCYFPVGYADDCAPRRREEAMMAA
jgi:hypothetical protein